jgi:uncharacterized protein (DUF2132 family)
MEQIKRKCKNCQEEKDLTNFSKNGSNYYRHICKKCDNNIYKDRRLAYNKEYRKLHPEKKIKWTKTANEKRKNKLLNDPDYHDRVKFLKRESGYRNKVSSMYNNARKRAQKNNIEFSIKKEDIIIPEKCPLLEVEFIMGRGKDYMYTPTIDRIDRSKGYTKDNICIISMLANSMKNAASPQELLTFSKNILNYINKDIVQPIEKSIELEDKELLG